MLRTVGQILRPHGIQGEVVVHVRTDEPERRFAEGSVLIAGPSGHSLTVESVRPHQGRLLIRFAEIPDRMAAEDARGTELSVDSADVAPPEDPEEFHDHQLVGLTVVTVAGAEVGKVTKIDHAPSADLLVIRRPGAADALVPFLRQMVPEVDVAGGRIVIDPPAGLLEL